MSFQPLFQSDEAGKTILDLAHKKLLPAISSFERLAVDVSDYRLTFWSSVYRRKFKKLESDFAKQNKDFLSLYHLYSTPDDLFATYFDATEKDPGLSGRMVADYFSSRPMIEKTFSEGFKLTEIIDRQLVRYSQSADQRVATVLAILAITISLISLFYK